MKQTTIGAVAAVAALAASTAVSLVPSASAASVASHLHVINYEPSAQVSPAAVLASLAGAAVPGGLPLFASAVHDGGTTYRHVMVGKIPSHQLTEQTTVVGTKVIPLIIHLDNGRDTFDPTTGNACDSTPAQSRLMQSPIFAAPRGPSAARRSAPRSTSTRSSAPSSGRTSARRPRTPTITSSSRRRCSTPSR